MSTTPEQHWAAVVAALSTAGVALPVYDYGEVPGSQSPAGDLNPGTTPTAYGLLSLERRYTPTHVDRVGRTEVTGWRVSLRVSGMSPTEVRVQTGRVFDALSGLVLVITGHRSTPVRHEASTDPAPDGDRYSALEQFTYTL